MNIFLFATDIMMHGDVPFQGEVALYGRQGAPGVIES